MKTKTVNQKSQGGFTLLELLIVVAILAIIGGALLSAYNGLTGIAANGVATNTISATSQFEPMRPSRKVFPTTLRLF